MTKNLSKELKKYYHEISKLLYCSNKEKKNIIGSIKSSVECYLYENPDSNIDDIIKKFGSAKDVADEYYNNESTEEISAKMKNSSKIFMCIVIGIIVALVLYVIVIISALIDNMNSVDNYSVTYITDVSSTDI